MSTTKGDDILEGKINEILNRFNGTRFFHNGRSLEEGIDCLGLLILFYKEFGVELPSDDGKPIEDEWYLNDPTRYIRAIRDLGYPDVNLDELKPLDLIFFVVNHDVITHSGIMLSNNRFVHMTPKKGLRVSKFERHWIRRFRGGVRVI